jgi:hypothetical protein
VSRLELKLFIGFINGKYCNCSRIKDLIVDVRLESMIGILSLWLINTLIAKIVFNLFTSIAAGYLG